MEETYKIQKRKMENKILVNLNLIKISFCIFLLSVFLISFVSAAQGSESYKPYLHKPSVGQAPKLQMYGNYQTQLFSGSSSYSYDIIVPKGTNGLSPQISLTYNSQAAFQSQGIVGSGWSVTSNSISRNINYTINDTRDDYFVLEINGYSDKIFYSNGVYNTFINDYLRIENKSIGGNTYWLITTTDGTKYKFGSASNSRLQSNSSNYILRWFLDSVEDTHGNLINYSYSKNPFSEDYGAVYPSNITYNNDLLRKIIFTYENATRPDKKLIYDPGDKFLMSRRMSGIEVYFSNSLVRRYAFSYKNLNEEKTLTGLSNITYIGSDSSSILNTVSFDYYDSQQGFVNSNNWLVPEEFASITSYSRDLGLRLVDVNNDGFVDLVKANDTTNYVKLNDNNLSWALTSSFSVPERIVNSSSDFQGVNFVDINRDGFVDLVKARAGSARKVYLGNGSGWTLSNWSVPMDFINGSGWDEGVRFVDFNGDGFIDILQAKELGNVKTAWLNNKTGWVDVSLVWSSPDYFTESSGNDTGLREIDFNSDGLTDLIKGGTPGSAWINNGTGFTNEPLYAPNINFKDNENPDLGVRFIDINGDNLADLIQNFYSSVTNSILNQTCFNLTNSTLNCTYYTYNITTLTNIKINNGSGWFYTYSWQSPESFTSNGYNTGRRIADVNGDGYSDIIVGYKNDSFDRRTWIRNATSAYLLKSIKNEYGGVTEVKYDKSTLVNNSQNLGFNIWLVNNMTLNNSLSGSFGVISKTSYGYSGGKYDYNNSEFLGFSFVNETLPDGTLILHYYSQDRILKGKEYLTQIYDKDNNHYSDQSNWYTYSTDNKIYLNASTSYNYEGNPTAVISNTTYRYDNYGNLVFINYSGNVAVSGDEKYEEYGYIYNTTIYLVDKVSNYSLYNSSGSLAKRYWNIYDWWGLTKGDLMSVEYYNNHGDRVMTGYYYDPYGNVEIEIDPNDNSIQYIYDSETNTFLNRTINMLGYFTDFSYDKGTGNLLWSKDSNGVYTNYTYDVFGRNTKEIMPLDSVSYPTKRTTYDFDGVAPEKITVETKNNDSYYSESSYFYDGFSNPVQIRLKYDNNLQIVKNYVYDSKFRIIEEQVPNFQYYSTQINLSSTNFENKYAYDSLDRVINITKKDNNISKIIFNNTKVISINENGIQKEYLLDIYDRITNVYEHNRNSPGNDEIYNTTYYYDASNNLIKIIDSQNNQFLFEYDSLGRKISIDDPNMEKWTYAYDLAGNLINQTDGRNVTIYLSYDQLNRLWNKSAGNISILFYYDKEKNGTLSSIDYNNSIFNNVHYEYQYDNRLRVIGEKLYFAYIKNSSISTDKNYWINTSVEYDSSDKIIKKYLPNQTFNYHFETGVNLTEETNFPNAAIVYNYNFIGKLSSINNFITNTAYNEYGSLVNKTYSNNLITNYKYDNLNRINSISTGNIQNLSYNYDSIGNVKLINDSKNKMTYSMGYDDLDRLTKTIIYNYNIFEHEKYIYNYNKIGDIVSTTTDTIVMNYSYDSSRAHAPIGISKNNRTVARIETSLVNPISTKNVSRYNFFNFTSQVCCKDNDCWGINVSLDPEEHSYSPDSETICKEGICNTVLYSETRFVYENDSWKNIEEASSLKGVWNVEIKEDSAFPVQIIDYNYTTITLNLSNTQFFRLSSIPLKVYSKSDKAEKPTDIEGNIKDKDITIRVGKNDWKTAVIDLSDTKESLLSQEIKWGDASTIITVYDNNSVDTDDSYIRDTTYSGQNYGSEPYLYIKNSSTSNQETLVRFDISQIPRQAVVDDAKFYLYLDTNYLQSNRGYNVSVFRLYSSYKWNESNVTWANGHPQSSDFNSNPLDKVYINTTYGKSKYVSWNVTSVIKAKNGSESFYVRATEYTADVSTNYLKFDSKEHPSKLKPYLNVTYRLKGLVSNTLGETPFYTTVSNPYYIDLEKDQCQNVTWQVNATGNLGNYIFFMYSNKTYNKNMYNYTDLVEVNII